MPDEEVHGKDWYKEVGKPTDAVPYIKRLDFYVDRAERKANLRHLSGNFDVTIRSQIERGRFKSLDDLKAIPKKEYPIKEGDTLFKTLLEFFKGITDPVRAQKEAYLTLAYVMKTNPQSNVDKFQVGGLLTIENGRLTVRDAAGVPSYDQALMRPETVSVAPIVPVKPPVAAKRPPVAPKRTPEPTKKPPEPTRKPSEPAKNPPEATKKPPEATKKPPEPVRKPPERVSEEKKAKERITAVLLHSSAFLQTATELRKDPNVMSREWTESIYTAMTNNRIPPTPQNIAVSITLMQRESSFREDPSIPDTRLMYARYREKLERKIDALPSIFSPFRSQILGVVTSYEARYKADFLACKTESQVETLMTRVFTDLDADPTLQTLFATPFIGSQLKDYWKQETQSYRNPIQTYGAMQVNLDRARVILQEKGMTFANDAALKRYLYTRDGNLNVGFSLVGDGIREYLDSGRGAIDHVFADYNAGPYACRNAAVQTSLNQLMGSHLDPDGDLLSYDKDGRPLATPSNTELQMRALRDRFHLGLTDAEIRRDLLKDKTDGFERTQLANLLETTYRTRLGTPPPKALIPAARTQSADKWGQNFSVRDYVAGCKRTYSGVLRGVNS